MAQALSAQPKINTRTTQAESGQSSRRPAGRGKARRPARGQVRMSGEGRRSACDPGRVVIELGWGVTVYPPEVDGEPWRATFVENGRRRYRQAATEETLAAKLETVSERLQAGASNMERPGADLIAHYLDPDRLPADKRWSRKHAHTQRRLCERFAAPGHRHGDVPGHHGLAHAADRERRAHGRGRRPGSRNDLGAGRCGHQWWLPGQPTAGQGALAGRPPARPRPAGDRGRGIGAVGRPRRDSRPR
jgi:hypothetical protein